MEVLGISSKWIFKFVLSFILISSFCQNGPIGRADAWDNAEFEMFDLVEEVNKNFYEVLGVSHVRKLIFFSVKMQNSIVKW